MVLTCQKSLDRGFKDRSVSANKVSAEVQNKVVTCLDCLKRGSRLGLDLQRESQQKSKTRSQYAEKVLREVQNTALACRKSLEKGFATGSRLANKFSTEVKDKVSIC